MNCANHPEAPVSAFCRECGKPMCQDCQRLAFGSIYCEEHVPAPAPARSVAVPQPPPPAAPYAASAYTPASSPYTPSSPYTAPAAPAKICDTNSHPLLAFILGFIPGVGALYNGQLVKGLIHAVVFGLLVSLASNSHSGGLEPLFEIMIAAWVCYMAFEAWHTAKKRRDGESVEEFSSLFDIRPTHGRFPAGAVLLIAVGFLLLLDTTDMIDMAQLDRYWPAGLIVLGLYMLYTRFTGDRNERPDGNAEARR